MQLLRTSGQSGHWYDRDGAPRHWQESGKKTTLAHARKQDLAMSVTSIPQEQIQLSNRAMDYQFSMSWRRIPYSEAPIETDKAFFARVAAERYARARRCSGHRHIPFLQVP